MIIERSFEVTKMCSVQRDQLVTHYKSFQKLRWTFLYFVLRFFTQFSNTQCLQWFVEGIVWFENPLYDSSKLHRTTSKWTVYNGSQIEVNRSRSTFRMSFVLKSSELLLYSSKILITQCGRGLAPYQLCMIFNWALGLSTFRSEEVQEHICWAL